MKKQFIAGLALASLVATTGSIAALTVAAGAQDSTTTTAVSQNANKDSRHREHLTTALDPLVTNGTINQSQEDAVVDALIEARPERGEGMGRGGRGAGMGMGDSGRNHGGYGIKGEGFEAAATALGMTEEDLRAELLDGKSLANVADEKGVEDQKVIDAMIAEIETHLDEEVAEGDITQDRANAILDSAKDRIEDRFDDVLPQK